MRKRIFRQMCALVILTVMLSMSMVTVLFYNQVAEDIHRALSNGASYIEAGVEKDGIAYLLRIEGQDPDSRITYIEEDGTVIFDSEVPLSHLDNHKDRPEVREALKTGVGQSVRMSDTLGEQTYYYAKKMSDGKILRLSSTTDNVAATLLKSIPWGVGIVTFVLLIALLLAGHQTKKLIAPINAIDLEQPAENEVYDELSPLLVRIHQQKLHIEEQMKELTQRQDEFQSITNHMEEGLVLLDRDGNLVSANRSALKLLKSEGTSQTGRHFSNLNRDLNVQRIVESALSGEPAEGTIAMGSSQVQLRANPAFEETRVKGAVLLFIDVTEQQKAEKMRREFSANVSHELKTPITAISGYAELIRDGLAMPQDVAAFAGKIHEEAARLVALINDIMRLSQLDENDVPVEKQDVDLDEIALSVIERLQHFSNEQGVSLDYEGETAFLHAVPRLMDELIFNLCENAIKYNRPGGSVHVRVMKETEQVILQVKDTGIGIPKEDCERIFERFYRVDKSHSKETGGTGLGLSIAKHIVSYHDGEITLSSELGEGTDIQATFQRV